MIHTTPAADVDAPGAAGASIHTTPEGTASAPDGNASEDRTEVMRIVIDADPASPDLTVVHVAGRGDQLCQLVRAVVDGARQLGQRVLEIAPVTR